MLQRYPGMRGILFDLPEMATRSRLLLDETGVADRCQVVAGDFFTEIPGGAAYVVKNIVHDWDDASVAAILADCRRAMAPDGRVLVVQEALAPGNAPSVGKLLDLQMLLTGGPERTDPESRALFAAAGLELTRIAPTVGPNHVIEGRAAASA